MESLREVKASVRLPPGLPLDLVRTVRQRAKEALVGHAVSKGLQIPFTAPISLKVEIGDASPLSGFVSPATLVDVTTMTGAKDEPEETNLFDTVVAPDPALDSKWETLAGCSERKLEILDVITKMIKFRKEFAAARHLTGQRGAFLLAGPPGTGKTTLVEGLAHKTALMLRGRVAVHYVKTATLYSKFVGESARNIAGLFSSLRDASSGYDCWFVVVDEFDAIAGDRNNEQDHPDAKRAVNAFLMEMDRFNFYDTNGFLFATTNIAARTDEAARRRFDAVYQFDLPTIAARVQILQHKLQNVAQKAGLILKLAKADIDQAAGMCHGYSGADLGRVVNKALFLALDANKCLTRKALLDAVAKTPPASRNGGRKA